jgi:ATP-dependent DNA helicase DinG
MKLEEIFSEHGLLDGVLSGFEYREEQLHMAMKVFEALQAEDHLIVESGTGVGKSLAYLVPLCLWLREQDEPRAIVSTYTKALQKQLFEKELPFIKEQLFPQLKFALSFGSENYLCLRRLAKNKQYGLFDIDDEHDIKVINAWINETATGLRGEVNVSHATWQKVNRETDVCFGKKCEYYTDCFYQTAKILERKANIIVCNHHLYFAHVASDYMVLPESRCVVFDEAHEIEGVASDHLGIMVSNAKLRYVLDSIISSKGKGLLLKLKWLDPSRLQDISSVVERVRKRGDQLFHDIHDMIRDGRSIRLHERPDINDELFRSLSELHAEVEALARLSGDEEEEKEILALSNRVRTFRDGLYTIRQQELDDYVYWASRENRVIRMTATPLAVADILREQVYATLSSAILTSATLSVNGQFDFIKTRLGLEDAKTTLFASPFDFREQTAVYLPKTIPDPNDEEYSDVLSGEISAILNDVRGNTLVLFTSYSLLNEVADRITIDYPVLKQGDKDSYFLLQEFRENQPAALFGTYTFWQGIDLQGDILRCVVITKLPFAVPSEPIVEARLEKIRSEGGNPFFDYQVPGAVITFKQGFGRLIRSRTDRGVVAILDSRIWKKSYGRFFINSLPEINIINDFHSGTAFLKQDV